MFAGRWGEAIDVTRRKRAARAYTREDQYHLRLTAVDHLSRRHGFATAEIAVVLGITRQHVNRMLADLRAIREAAQSA